MKVAVPTNATLRVKKKDVTSQRIQAYDVDNGYPQRVINIIAASGTASACADLLKKHLMGRGFAEPSLDKIVVNKKDETLSKVRGLICGDSSKFPAFALHIGYNALFEVTSITHVPFEMVRVGIPDENGVVTQLAVHPDWTGQTKAKKVEILYYDAYTKDPEKILAQVEKAGGFNEWKGHILYFSETGIMEYPPAVGDAVLEDMISDWGVKIYRNRGIATGFSASHFFYHYGEFENDEARQDFIENLNSMQGFESAFKVVVVELKEGEQKPEMDKLEPLSKDPQWDKAEETARENIIRRYQQPRTLHALQIPGSLGLSKEWEEAEINYDKRTEDQRNRIATELADIMSRWHEGDPGKGKEDAYKVIPLTGLQPKFPEKTLSEILSGDALNKFFEILSGNMETELKIEVLVATFPVSREKVEQMLKPKTDAA